MAFFKFRKGGDDQKAAAVPTESVEALRKRAKHRLIGTAILVLAGVIGFPLLVDRQPRPVAVDIPIEIPDKNKVKPLVVAPAPVAASSVATPAPAAEPKPTANVVRAEAALQADADKPAHPAVPVESPKPAEHAVEKKADASVKKVESAPVASGAASSAGEEGRRAQALLDGKDDTKDASPAHADAAAKAARIVVQVGAFSDAAKAREVRFKLEHAGLKTYTHVAETKEGKRIRVRVGPYPTRAEADKAAAKIKTLNLPAVILTL